MDDTSIPLCVDMDGTLTPVDTLHESLLSVLRRRFTAIFGLLARLARGKAAFKQAVARTAAIDVALLPLRAELLDWLRGQRGIGRSLYLVTAADARIAQAVADRVGLFDAVIASDGARNLAGASKGAALVERFGAHAFDYVGNEARDLAVWSQARRAIVVGGAGLERRAARVADVERRFAGERPSLRTYLRAIRIHQWVKNALVFLPALAGHAILRADVLKLSLLAFIAFGLCASSVYVINDLFDLESDRRHPRKRLRAFAAGTLPVRTGILLAAALLAAAIAISWVVGARFCAVLAAYYLLTWTYSVRLKRAAIVDVMALAALYTLRILAGAAATGISPSFWLLALSMFMFLSLGVVKRYTELLDAGQEAATGSGRGYWGRDLPLLMTLGTGAGLCAVVVMALYINSPESQRLYRHAEWLWIVCPLAMYWIIRVWLLTVRGQMHDDPVIFATSDAISLVTFAIIAVIAIAAI